MIKPSTRLRDRRARKTSSKTTPRTIRQEPDQAAPNSAEAAAPSSPGGKLGVMVALLRRPERADLGALVDATDWQAHSVRGAMSGALKRRLGLTITSIKTNGNRIYRIPEEVGR